MNTINMVYVFKVKYNMGQSETLAPEITPDFVFQNQEEKLNQSKHTHGYCKKEKKC